jgi:muramoyltetrapeptide carboxypeptidase LdcA involved in peptidoglycan recycling
MINSSYKKALLTGALEARANEITEYQVNIDNFQLALAKVGDDEYLQEFKKQLEELLKSSLFEQAKAKIMFEVIQSQLGE